MSLVHDLRRVLRRLDRTLASKDDLEPAGLPAEEIVAPATPPEFEAELRVFLRSIDLPPEGRAYLEDHLARIVRTVGLVRETAGGQRVLELGAYMQMTPALECVLKFKEVRAAYLGPVGTTETKAVTAGGESIFRCDVDLFDVERDEFPYAGGSFDVVLACEIFEHLLLDPMHMLIEIHRVLRDGGTLVLTTPNAASLTAVARILQRTDNPQLYSRYPNPAATGVEIPHVREYTPNELRTAVESAGFATRFLFTERSPQHLASNWVEPLLKNGRFPTELRGEQMYYVGTMHSGMGVTRYPTFLYDS